MLKLLKLRLDLPFKIRFFLISLVAGLAICLSLLLEYFSDQLPCYLCLIQRWIYISLLPLSLIGTFSKRKEAVRRCCQIILVMGLLVSGYHTLVQLKLVKDRCLTPKIENLTAYKNLLNRNSKQRPSCSKSVWKIGPFPLPILNGLLSFILLILTKNPEEALQGKSLE